MFARDIIVWLERADSQKHSHDVAWVTYNNTKHLSGSPLRGDICREEDDGRSTCSRYHNAPSGPIRLDPPFRDRKTGPGVVWV